MKEGAKRKAWIIAYGSGDMGYQFLYDFFKNFQNYFLTEIAGFSTALTAAIVSAVNIFKIFFSPTTGIIIDKHPFGKKDKFTPWIKGMPFILTALFLIMAIGAWKGMPQWVVIVGFVGAYSLNLFLFNAYRGAIPSISKDQNEASFITTVVNLWKEVGRAVAGILGPLLIVWFAADKITADGKGFVWAIIIFGAATIVTYLVSSLGISKTINTDALKKVSQKKALSFGTMMKQVFTNGPLLIIFIVTSFVVVRYFVIAPIAPYFFKYVIGDMKQMAWYSAATQIAAIGATALAPIIIKYVIKDIKKLFFVVLLGMIIPHLCLYITGSSLWGFNILMTVAQAFYSLASVYMLVLFVSAVDYATWKAMKNNEAVADGTSMSMYFTAVMVAQVLGASIRNWGLSLAGYAGAKTVATPEFTSSLISLMAWLPSACCVVALIAFLFYKVDNKKLAEIRAELAAMKAERAEKAKTEIGSENK